MLLSICLVHNDISIWSFDLCRRFSREKPPDHIPPVRRIVGRSPKNMPPKMDPVPPANVSVKVVVNFWKIMFFPLSKSAI